VYCRSEICYLAEEVDLIRLYERGKMRAKSLSRTVSPAARTWATILVRCTAWLTEQLHTIIVCNLATEPPSDGGLGPKIRDQCSSQEFLSVGFRTDAAATPIRPNPQPDPRNLLAEGWAAVQKEIQRVKE
jgi:hypothetical protein